MIQKYKNKKTGAIIDATSEMGGDWKPYAPKQNISLEESEEQQQVNTEVTDNEQEMIEAPIEPEETTDNIPEEITKAQIIQELDAFGVKYNPRDKKQVLYDLMIAQGK